MAFGALVLLSLLVPGVFSDITVTSGNCSYYWTLYNGTTPSEAVLGGVTPEGELFFLALVQLKLINEIYVGMLIHEKKYVRITSLGLAKEVKNDPFTVVNILCSRDGKAFKWVETKSEDLALVPHLVNGGKVLGQDLYIGRIRKYGGTLVGKVFPHKFIYQGLYVPEGNVFAQFMEYEVLTFNCDYKIKGQLSEM
ncbi:uncharacterized protein LOC103313380 [Tribolium castaneum]|uniref:Uncharacterized protein n=1 Tax=Tribolium castaneum TaxID=7070 RepID=D2A5E9_TRICA|nr:PREDICTED: uncharacterized protein LOC103313380 [Tribolium castaneum]XP_015836395.1 PREDICTED: uncharacterized protein LOC103313380 [Tribolium castaneum]XP_015836396.1 PREDICTED: uncharacterized protein LOC103313380 [Tribolium castaneum]EFA05089.1 hypothetical protein TcasGA2_TC015187 [Tribolium castaneum]|eukprot:XP_008194689.1 PREDICTED: uncharacterized protein LOC103313380 [Tribolium castaneum]